MKAIMLSKTGAMHKRRFFNSVAPLLAAGALGLTGCKGGDDPVCPPSTQPTLTASPPAKALDDKKCEQLVKEGDYIHRDGRDYIRAVSIDDHGIVLEEKMDLGFLPESKPERVRINFNGTVVPKDHDGGTFRAEKTAIPGIVRLLYLECREGQ